MFVVIYAMVARETYCWLIIYSMDVSKLWRGEKSLEREL